MQADLQQIAAKLRGLALEAIFAGGSGHPGGSLSLGEIMAALYFEAANIDANDPKNPKRDRVVLSKGHACPILYAALCLKGFITKEQLLSLRHTDSFLQGHPDMKGTPGVDMSTGSLGQGLGQGISAACGIAMGAKLKKEDFHVYAILGDGELDEGQVWEALMFAAHYKLDNLTIIVDHNGLQIDGPNSEVMDLSNLKARFDAFGLNTIEIDGNNLDEVRQSLALAREVKGKPTIILANTVKGKGVSFMENQVGWHGKAPSKEDLAKALAELGVEE